MEILNLHELEQLAQARLPKLVWDYYASGSDDERCVRRNREAFEEVALHYRVLVDIAHRDLATSVLGQRIALPFGVAPMAFHRLDGGVRRSTDVVKALALGARAVFVGRPILWGLAAGGYAGAAAVLGVLRREVDLAMALCGCPSIASITRDLVAP